MKLKLNWGTGIALFYIIFVLFWVGNLIFSATVPINLVEEDYYAQEMKYQDKIEMQKNTQKLAEQPILQYADNSFLIKLPSEFKSNDIRGDLHFYRPSDSKLDKRYELDLTAANSQVFDVSELQKGVWRAKLSWKAGELSYFNETLFRK